MKHKTSSAPPLLMSERQYKLLMSLHRKRKLSRQNYTRISILLRARNGESNHHIARAEEIVVNTVKKWRSRWSSVYEQLLEYENGLSSADTSDSDLINKMLELLKDAPRSGAPARISMAQKQEIRALACESPEKYGIPISVWSHELLAKVAIKEKIVESITARHIGNILKKRGN